MNLTRFETERKILIDLFPIAFTFCLKELKNTNSCAGWKRGDLVQGAADGDAGDGAEPDRGGAAQPCDGGRHGRIRLY